MHSLLQSAGIHATPQGSDVKEISEALKSASKKGTGNAGFPEFTAVIKDFLLIIEDKADLSFHIKLDSHNTIDLQNPKSVMDYAVNGAIHYAKHLAKHTSYTKIIAIGVSGDEKHHKISPYFVSERGRVSPLKDIEDFIVFSQANIDEYYTKEILQEKTSLEKSTEQILKDASILHEDLRNYGNLRDTEKPIVVAGILLALEEIKHKNFGIENLNGDTNTTDGEKIYKAISDNLKRANVRPEVKKDKLLAQFSIIKDTPKINTPNATLGKTPLKHYAEFLYKNIYQSVKYTHSAEDILGRFYSEFMSYSGGDGQTLGIVLTPKHICELFCDLAQLRPDDVVFDPCCGTAGFLIAAMHDMLGKVPDDETKRKHIKESQLFGIEEKPDMFSIATTNMILRGDGKSNLENKDFLKQNPHDLQKDICASVGMMNPPYSQGSKANPDLYEIAFVEHLLDSLAKNARCIVIIPQSALTGKNNHEKIIKENILKHHTLEGVITLNKNTFYGVGTNPCIAVFSAYNPHPKDKICKFINFENDGFEVQKHKGLVQTINAKDKKAHLLNVWFDKMEAQTKFCVKTTIQADDEWLHSFYYFNDEIPTQEDFEKTMADYLTFEFNMITHGRGYLFGVKTEENKSKLTQSTQCTFDTSTIKWKEFKVKDIFKVTNSKSYHKTQLITNNGDIPYITRTSFNNGLECLVQNDNFLLNPKDTISLGAENADFFYQGYEYITGNKMYYLQNNHINRYVGLFITQMLQISIKNCGFGYGIALTGTRLKDRMIYLPIDSNGNPHYAFMESTMRKLEQKHLRDIFAYFSAKANANTI